MWLNDASIHSLLLLLISIACNFSSTESKKKEKTSDPDVLKRIQNEIHRSMKRMMYDTVEHTDVNKYVAFKKDTEAEVIVEVNTWRELKQEIKERIIYIETGMWPGDETPKKANKPNETEAPPQQAGGRGVAATQTVGNVSTKQTEAQANATDTKKSIQKEKPLPKKESKDSSKA
ncbi:hypothetical protein Ddc_18215 [Ditylenchus destructor]|nr:hypothetical protein Ddc_18215 [Ditylenchus destructor]